MSPENTHKLMGFYMEVLILGVNTTYMVFCFFKLFLIGCIGLTLEDIARRCCVPFRVKCGNAVKLTHAHTCMQHAPRAR